jgi:ATP-binding cassette subfamily C protein CydC
MKKFLKPFTPFLNLLGQHTLRMLLGTFLGWVAVLASVGLLALSGWFISAAAFAGLTLSTAHLFNFFFPSIGVRLFAATRTLARYAERITNHDVTFRILASLRVWFYRKIEPLAPARLMQYRSADLLNRIVCDIDALDNLYVRTLSPSVVAIFTILVVVVLLAFFDIWMAGSALIWLLVSGMIVPLIAARAGSDLGRRLVLQTASLRIRIVESIQGMAVLMLYHAWGRQIESLQSESQSLLQIQKRMGNLRGLSAAATILISGMATLTVLSIGIDRIETGDLDGTNLALVVFAVLASFEALAPLPLAYQYMGQTQQAGKRLTELVQGEPLVTFPPHTDTQIRHHDVLFNHVDFYYPQTEYQVLKDFNLHIQDGQHVVVLGETGAGKSTLVNLLARFWDPFRGSIQIGGHDIRNLSEPDLRKAIGIVSQNAHLFHTTLGANLNMARPEADEAAMQSALEKAQLREWVESLPQGLNSWIGEGGRTISGGQARRLILARLILQDAPIWVLDEPLEGLDPNTRGKLMSSLLHAAKNRTLLMITHITSHLEQFDQIIILDNGRIQA